MIICTKNNYCCVCHLGGLLLADESFLSGVICSDAMEDMNRNYDYCYSLAVYAGCYDTSKFVVMWNLRCNMSPSLAFIVMVSSDHVISIFIATIIVTIIRKFIKIHTYYIFINTK